MQTTYTTEHMVTTTAHVDITPGAIKSLSDLENRIKSYKVATDGSIIYRPEQVADDTVTVELDGGVEATITLEGDKVSISAIDTEEGATLDVIADPETLDLIKYFETI